MKINKTYLLFLLLGILFLSLSMRRKCEGFIDWDAIRRQIDAQRNSNRRRRLDLSSISTRRVAPTPAPTPPPVKKSLSLFELAAKVNKLQQRERRKSLNLVADGFLTFEAQKEVAIRVPALLRRVRVGRR